MKGRLLSIVLCLALLVSSFSLLATDAKAASSDWDGRSSNTGWTGSGTASAPYIISTAAQLKGLADQVNSGTAYSGAYFKLGSDINLANYAWTPIGGHCTLTASEEGVPTGNYFSGIFNGDDHTISGIKIANLASDTGAYGFFGYVKGGVIANLSVAGSLNMGDNYTSDIGSVVGYTTGSLYNLHSSMTIYTGDPTQDTASQAGGIAGVVQNTDNSTTTYVMYCSNTGSVTARGRIGGIVGAVYCVSNGGVIVDQCFNSGSLTSVYSTIKIYTGGIVGYCRGYITNCYNRGSLTTNNGHYLAGLVGLLQGSNPTASMSNCYSTAVFYNYNIGWDRWLWASADKKPAVHITNCFWLPDDNNTDITQPNDTKNSWGTQTHVSAITSAELKGIDNMTESNLSGDFSGHVVDNYLGAADLNNANGSYGFGYAQTGGYPILGWQQIQDFKVDLSNVPIPVTYYTVSASVSSGSGTATANPVSVTYNESSVITISASDGYSLLTITDNGDNVTDQVTGNTYTLENITANHTISVYFTNYTYSLTYTAGSHGYISGTSPQTAAYGESGSAVTAVPDSGYHFVMWSDNSTANPRTDVDVTADIAEKAIFIADNTGSSQTSDHFTIAVLPDTQFYSESYADIFDNQTQWITDNAQSENIVFAAHLGDLVNDYNDSTQWKNAHDSMAILRASGLPYSVVPGNHDIEYESTNSDYFDQYFPYTDFENYTWYGGHYSTSNANNFELFSAMEQDFVILNLVCEPSLLSDNVTDWANDVLTQYSTRKAIIITHGYIDTNGDYLNGASVSGLSLWNNVVQSHSNVIAVLCGHESGEYYNISTGSNGNTICNLLTDYQDEENGGDGWLRLYEFYPQTNKIKAITYSPYSNKYDTSAYGRFDLSLDMGGVTSPIWDLNDDGVCDVCDLADIGSHWGQKGDDGWIPEDLNSDGAIDICDLAVLGYYWGEKW